MKTVSSGSRIRALRESETRIRAILDTVVEAIITLDVHGVIRAFNPAAERMFGHTAGAIIGSKFDLLVPTPLAQRPQATIRRHPRPGRARRLRGGHEAVGYRRDGTRFPIELDVREVRHGQRPLRIVVVRDITERKQAESEITRISEEERRRFGQELHDGLAQQLTGLSLLAKALEQRLVGRVVRAGASDIVALSSRILDEVRMQAHGLYPIELERHGLNAALRELVTMQKRLFHVACRYHSSSDMPHLETSQALHVYRIAQEAVSNAVKHSHAKHVEVKLEKIPGGLKLTIEDDGRGIREEDASSEGMGLSIMRHRAHALGANFEICRGAKGGTVVACAWNAADTQQDRPKKGDGHGRKRPVTA